MALLCGALVYAVDRDPARVWLLPAFASLQASPLHFGTLGQWLPSFVHPFAFSLLSAALWPRSASPAYAACAMWWAVDMAFEAAQHTAALELLNRVSGGALLTGRFDPADLAAVTAGALAAAAVLRRTHRMEMHHAQ